MKLKKILIMLSMAFAMVVMLLSCTSYKRPTITWPTTLPMAIETSMIEVTGDKGETLRIEFDRDTGRCKESFVNGEPTNCKGFGLSDTYYCIPPDNQHPANTDMNNDGKRDVYCGNVKFLTEGTDIQFEAESAAGNKKCKNVGGTVICY